MRWGAGCSALRTESGRLKNPFIQLAPELWTCDMRVYLWPNKPDYTLVCNPTHKYLLETGHVLKLNFLEGPDQAFKYWLTASN